MKYGNWLQLWLDNYVKPAVKQRTYERYGKIIERHVSGVLGEYELDELLPSRLQIYTVSMLKSGNLRGDGGLRPNTVNSIITVIQHSLKAAYAAGETSTYIGDRIQRPAVRKTEINCFTLEEQRRIEEEIAGKKNVKMYGIILCMYTGLRLGELLALEKTDTDGASIRVTKSCHDGKDANGKFTRRTDTPKTPSSVRVIPVPKQLRPLVRALQKNGKSQYLISARDGKVIAVRSYQRSFELLLKRLGIPHRGFHALRHTFATRALECGMDVKTLSEILGHKNPSTTLLHYAHSLDEHKNAMMNKVGEFLS